LLKFYEAYLNFERFPLLKRLFDLCLGKAHFDRLTSASLSTGSTGGMSTSAKRLPSAVEAFFLSSCIDMMCDNWRENLQNNILNAFSKKEKQDQGSGANG
jgi:hypothetical protein